MTDEVEAARSAAINQEINVTDELFDEIATKVLDEDEPNAEAVESIILGKPRVSPPPSVPIPKESPKSLLPQRTDNASNSDNDDENGRIPSRKLDSTSHRPETNAMSYEHSLKNMKTAMELPNADSNGDVKKEKISINFESAGESRGDDVKGLKSNEAASNERVKRPEIANRDRTITEACGDGEANILSNSDQILERSLNTRVPIKEVAGGSHRSDNERRHVKDNSAGSRASASSEDSFDNPRKRKLQSRGSSLSASPRPTKRVNLAFVGDFDSPPGSTIGVILLEVGTEMSKRTENKEIHRPNFSFPHAPLIPYSPSRTTARTHRSPPSGTIPLDTGRSRRSAAARWPAGVATRRPRWSSDPPIPPARRLRLSRRLLPAVFFAGSQGSAGLASPSGLRRPLPAGSAVASSAGIQPASSAGLSGWIPMLPPPSLVSPAVFYMGETGDAMLASSYQSAVSSASQSGTLPGISPPLSSGHTSLTVNPPESHGSSGSLKITTVALDGTNYLEWSRAAQHAIRSHQLYGLIDGTTMEPPRADPSWKKWDADNSLVVSWLLHSMSPQVYRSYMLLDSAYDIWSRARDTYSQAGSSMQIYELTRRVLELKQGTMTVAAYYSEFERLYQELDFFNTFTAACTADAIALQRDKDRFRIHVFLMGLNMEFDAVRLHVLHREPLPSLREAFGMLLSDENRRRTLGPTTDHSALAGISRGPLLFAVTVGRKVTSKTPVFDYIHTLHQPVVVLVLVVGVDIVVVVVFLVTVFSLLRTLLRVYPVASHAAVATSGLTSAHAVSSTPSEWIIDSGATDHMTGSASGFTSYTPLSGRDKVIAANGSLSAIAGKGTVSCSPDLSLSSVIWLRGGRLAVVEMLADYTCSTTLLPVLYLPPKLPLSTMSDAGINAWVIPPLYILLNYFLPLLMYFALFLVMLVSCLSMFVKKTRHLSVPSLQPFDVIHSDVWGPSRVTSLSGYKWFVTFIDCHSRTTWLYLLKQKSDVFPCFQNFHKMVSHQFGGTIRVLRSDNGGEYDDRGKFGAYLANHGILHQTTCVHTSTQNGVAERKNRHLLEVARCLLLAMHLPKSYWGDAVLTAAHLINRLPSRALSFDTPLSRLAQNHVVHTSHLPPRIFGSVCFVHVHTPHRDKLDARSLRCVFVGYSPTTKGYRWGDLYDDETIESPLPIVVTSSPIVVTSSPSSAAAPIDSSLPIVSTSAPPILYTYSRRPKTDEQGQSVDVSPVPVTASSPDSEDDLHIPLAQLFGKQGSTKYPIANYISYSHLSPAHKAFISSLSSIMIPKTWQEAIQVPEWKQAMEEELRALHKNNTWQLVDLPPGKRTVGSRWVFKSNKTRMV
ncbi:hypothetical protein KSP39_PZI011284 [Platanthera zijinensis]|uniref:Integrase catalytic domain-containing protein n=1 Tax=Platanthera zijinensis TaxID=2320716 RepID=A0AAP0BHG7_9ASPA